MERKSPMLKTQLQIPALLAWHGILHPHPKFKYKHLYQDKPRTNNLLLPRKHQIRRHTFRCDIKTEFD